MAGLQVKEGYEGLTASVSLAVAILKKCRINTWDELLAAMADNEPFVVKTFSALELGNSQLELLGGFTPVLQTISIKPVTVPAICPACGLYVLLGTGTVPSKCLVTAGCTGKPVKPTAATTAKEPVADFDSDPSPAHQPSSSVQADEQPPAAEPEAAEIPEDLDLTDLELPPPGPPPVIVYDDDLFA